MVETFSAKFGYFSFGKSLRAGKYGEYLIGQIGTLQKKLSI